MPKSQIHTSERVKGNKVQTIFMRKQDISVLLLYYLGYSSIRNLIFRLQHKPQARFVAFHDIVPEMLECFESKLRFLKQNTNVVSLDDFFSGRLSSENINVVITFDDGFKSWVSYAIPILKKLELPATFFMSSGFLGLPKEDEAEFVKSKLLLNQFPDRNIVRGLNLNDVKSIVDEGFTIGGHTLNHCNLAKIRNKEQLEYEIIEDKKRLERMAGVKIEYFAYPLGSYSNPDINLVEVLREAGYRGAVTTEPGFNTVMSNQYLLHRELTNASMAERVFRARVYGNFDGVLFLKRWIENHLKRA